MIEIKDLTKSFDGVEVLSHISMTLEKGKIYGLVGRNGSGKTMLMKHILGFVSPTSAGVEIPPSLVNIYKELHEDLGCYIPDNGYLVKWANQGVLMLNTLLTVRAHQAFSHKGIGWEQFTDAAIEALARQDRPMVFILWGRPAQSKKPMIYNSKHLILESAHPSPLSAYRGFFGSRPFSRTNEYLKENGLAPIDWQIENRM